MNTAVSKLNAWHVPAVTTAFHLTSLYISA